MAQVGHRGQSSRTVGSRLQQLAGWRGPSMHGGSGAPLRPRLPTVAAAPPLQQAALDGRSTAAHPPERAVERQVQPPVDPRPPSGARNAETELIDLDLPERRIVRQEEPVQLGRGNVRGAEQSSRRRRAALARIPPVRAAHTPGGDGDCSRGRCVPWSGSAPRAYTSAPPPGGARVTRRSTADRRSTACGALPPRPRMPRTPAILRLSVAPRASADLPRWLTCDSRVRRSSGRWRPQPPRGPR